MKLVTLI